MTTQVQLDPSVVNYVLTTVVTGADIELPGRFWPGGLSIWILLYHFF